MANPGFGSNNRVTPAGTNSPRQQSNVNMKRSENNAMAAQIKPQGKATVFEKGGIPGVRRPGNLPSVPGSIPGVASPSQAVQGAAKFGRLHRALNIRQWRGR